MKAAQRREIFARLAAANPQPRTELRYTSTFELLIAVMLSAQSTDVSVNKATKSLFATANTPAAILALGDQGLRQHIKSLGLYNTKTKNILKTCELLLRDHMGKVPQQRKALEALPGVGRKTANVILNTAFGHPTLAVDTHIFRVARRLGLSRGNTPRAVEEELLKSIPKNFLKDAHHWLILHGRYVCTARKPRCHECPIADLCEYSHKTDAA